MLLKKSVSNKYSKLAELCLCAALVTASLVHPELSYARPMKFESADLVQTQLTSGQSLQCLVVANDLVPGSTKKFGKALLFVPAKDTINAQLAELKRKRGSYKAAQYAAMLKSIRTKQQVMLDACKLERTRIRALFDSNSSASSAQSKAKAPTTASSAAAGEPSSIMTAACPNGGSTTLTMTSLSTTGSSQLDYQFNQCMAEGYTLNGAMMSVVTMPEVDDDSVDPLSISVTTKTTFFDVSTAYTVMEPSGKEDRLVRTNGTLDGVMKRVSATSLTLDAQHDLYGSWSFSSTNHTETYNWSIKGSATATLQTDGSFTSKYDMLHVIDDRSYHCKGAVTSSASQDYLDACRRYAQSCGLPTKLCQAPIK